MNGQISAEVRRLMGLILRRDIPINAEVRRDQEPAWDSLKHVEIMFVIEDHFSVKFSAAEFAGLASIDQIAAAVESRVAA